MSGFEAVKYYLLVDFEFFVFLFLVESDIGRKYAFKFLR
jgi:hypothetical protein